MAKAPVLGKTTKADLPKDLFAEPFHHSLVDEAARADLAARRRGTASTLTPAEVAVTGAKAARQKGGGRGGQAVRAGGGGAGARAAAAGPGGGWGGVAPSAPTPRHYTVKVNRKA